MAAAQPAPATRPVSAARAAPPAEAPGGTFTYQAEGRRDPFQSLIGAVSEPRVTAVRGGDGPASLVVGEISVRGVLRSRGEYLAMVQGSDSKTHVIRQGDKFADGVVKSVTPQGLVIVRDVHDPLSLVKQQEIRKLLRSVGDGK
jgi:hypothetical protein